jgi:ribonuclease P protein component
MRNAARLRKSAEFRDVRKRGRRVSDELMAFGSARSDSAISRYGLAVSKRVGGSVTRNKVKRRLRECFSTLEILPNYDIVVSTRPAAAQVDYQMLLSSLRRLAGRAGVLQSEETAPVNNSLEGTVNQSPLEKRRP